MFDFQVGTGIVIHCMKAVNSTNEEINMKSISKVLFITTLMFGSQTVIADPVSELTAIATTQIAEQAAAMKANLAEQLQQSLSDSLAEALSEDAEAAKPEVVAGLASNEATIVE